MSNIKWYYPDTVQDTVKLLHEDGNILYSGGTGIIMKKEHKRSSTLGFISIKNLDLNTFEVFDNKISLGSSLTYEETSQLINAHNPQHPLAKSLNIALPPALRNLVTLGGSLAMSPMWSDLIGPLVALNASVTIEGKNKGEYKVTEIVKNHSLLKNSIITSITFDDSKHSTYYFRLERVRFDYSTFNITLLYNDKQKESISLVVYGTKDKYRKLEQLEQKMKEKSFVSKTDIAESITDIEFVPKTDMTSDYIKHNLQIELERAFDTIGGLK